MFLHKRIEGVISHIGISRIVRHRFAAPRHRAEAVIGMKHHLKLHLAPRPILLLHPLFLHPDPINFHQPLLVLNAPDQIVHVPERAGSHHGIHPVPVFALLHFPLGGEGELDRRTIERHQIVQIGKRRGRRAFRRNHLAKTRPRRLQTFQHHTSGIVLGNRAVHLINPLRAPGLLRPKLLQLLPHASRRPIFSTKDGEQQDDSECQCISECVGHRD